MENGLVKVWFFLDVFFMRLFDLYNDRNDNKDDYNVGSYVNDRFIGVG